MDASPEVLAALTRGPGEFLPDETATEETLRAELRRVCMLAPHELEEALKDLLFLRLEARVLPLSAQSRYASLLADVRAAYASHLAGGERYAEACAGGEGVRAGSSSEGWGSLRPAVGEIAANFSV